MSDHDPTVPPQPADSAAERASAASAVAVPLVALGLLAAAVWLGSAPRPAPAPQTPAAAAADPLPSWNDGPTKRAIVDFVAAVTRRDNATFVPPAERIAVFDHDGTLVCEKPVLHGMFLVDRVRALVERQPELAHEEPYATLLTGDLEFVRRLGKKFFADVTFSALAGVPEEQLEAEAREFIRTARHPVFDVPLGAVTYQPMKELIALLRAEGFTVWICSGSGVHFMRPAAEEWFGVGPEHVIASRPLTEMREVGPATAATAAAPNKRLDLVALPELLVLNDEERKPVSIGEHIGRRPIFAAGNVGTKGDIAMLRWSQSGARPSLQLLVLHDDAEREMAYGEPTNASLEAAATYGWHVVRMAGDWKRVFPSPLQKTDARPAAAADPAAGPPPTDWAKELAACAELDRTSPPAPGGVCLLGSSNISRWTTLAEDLPGMNVVNRGVSGCRLEELADHAAVIVAAARPRVVVVAAGTNDISTGRTPAEVCRSFERLAANVQAAQPQATIAFLAISPTIRRRDQRDRQQAANLSVQQFIADRGPGGRLVYLDANAAFLGPDGEPAAECFLDDLQHPSTIGNARRA
ncbi:MAG: hypothetical protein EBR23_08310, partial [Planctomycetia bacterium]|nr:hypothetical protein [Planctomycetia bacterium]